MLAKLAPALFIATLASAATAQDIGGNYFVKGTNLDGSLTKAPRSSPGTAM
jgi:hypothetical protein